MLSILIGFVIGCVVGVKYPTTLTDLVNKVKAKFSK